MSSIERDGFSGLRKRPEYPGTKGTSNEMPGVPLQSIWTDINPELAAQAVQNANYATQKPESLLERIISCSPTTGIWFSTAWWEVVQPQRSLRS